MSNTNLIEQIDALVASKTFNLDALDGIKKIKDDLTKTLAELDTTKKALLQMQSAHNNLNAQLADAEARVERLRVQIKANEETVKQGQEAI